MQQQFSYQAVLAASQRVNWRVEDIIGGDKRLDFAKPFLPESLARVMPLSFLNERERLALNQIRGHGYLYMFGLVEEFILPFVMDHARPRLSDDDYRIRALLQFASEEAKHIHLFKCFRDEFIEGFETSCEVIGPPSEVAKFVLNHHPLAVALTVLHIEWMTQRHYLESVKDEQVLDSQFKSLLRHHWMEEAQHAKLDVLMVDALADGCPREEIDRAVAEYITIGGFLDDGLMQQVRFDMDALTEATGRSFTQAERAEFITVQRQASRWTFLGSGMTHPNFLEALGRLDPAARTRVEALSAAFC